MRTIQKSPISPFGGLNFVLEEAVNLKINKLLEDQLPKLPPQSRYNWFDIFMSYWSVFFSGGDCAEDLDINIKSGLQNNPFIKIPSPDRVLERVKSLSDESKSFTTERGTKKHWFSLSEKMNRLNLQLLCLLPDFKKQGLTLDYDNTLIFTKKKDARSTYKNDRGYCPGVSMVGKHIVYVENRNGNSAAHILQDKTIDRMFAQFAEFNVVIDAIRADSASYSHDIINSMEKGASRIFIKARTTHTVEQAIAGITDWKEIKINNKKQWIGCAYFTPFKRKARGNKEKQESLKQYRLVVTKEARKDGQINIFTGEACNYQAVLTNDHDLTDVEVICFYNARGACEREFDELKNDFGWRKMPFSKMEQNSVYLILMAMCKNLYQHMIIKFSKSMKYLSPHFRIKKFIFRFICMPAKWIRTGRMRKLNIYSSHFT